MIVRAVDERDATEEIDSVGFRVLLIDEGRVAAFDLEGGTLRDVSDWAEENKAGGRYALAARVRRADDGLELVWLSGQAASGPMVG